MDRKINWIYLGIELLVVFLGISAGFFLQNYKDHKANNELEASYFDGLVDDLNTNINNLKKDAREDSLWLTNTKYAIQLMVKDSLTIDSANTIIASMLYYSKFEPQTNT